MSAVVWIFRVLIFLILLRFLLRLVFGTAFARRAPQPRHVPERLGGELVRDPVCGTFVAVSTPFKKTIGGETLHFCSAACRDKHNA